MDIETLQGKKVDIDDVSTLSLRDIYLRICACRDFEISLVWHRAIFLTAFLIGSFTAYGAVAGQMFKDGKFIFSGIPNLLSFIVALIGVIVSMLWIMMAKGSKAWYELYESAIEAFAVANPAGCSQMAASMSKCKWRDLIESAHKVDSCIAEKKRDQKLFSSCGGAFSVSRINIGIGQVSAIVWIGIAIGHTLLAFRQEHQDVIGSIVAFFENPFGMIILGGLVVIGFPILSLRWFKSGSLS